MEKQINVPDMESHVFYILQGKNRLCYASNLEPVIEMFYKNAKNNLRISTLELDNPDFLLRNLNKNPILLVMLPSSDPESEMRWWFAPIDGENVRKFIEFMTQNEFDSTYEAAKQFVHDHEEQLLEEFGVEKSDDDTAEDNMSFIRKSVIAPRKDGIHKWSIVPKKWE